MNRELKLDHIYPTFLSGVAWEYILCALEADLLRFRDQPDRWSQAQAVELYYTWLSVRDQLGLHEQSAAGLVRRRKLSRKLYGVEKPTRRVAPPPPAPRPAAEEGERTEKWDGPPTPVAGGGGGSVGNAEGSAEAARRGERGQNGGEGEL